MSGTEEDQNQNSNAVADTGTDPTASDGGKDIHDQKRKITMLSKATKEQKSWRTSMNMRSTHRN